jgi:hypothetical protein
MKKIALYAFNGEPMCFVHVMLYALDFQARGVTVKIVMEGSATRLIKDLADPSQPLAGLYREIREKGLIGAVCQACSAKMGTLETAREQNLPIDGSLKGHPSLAADREAGFEIFTF